MYSKINFITVLDSRLDKNILHIREALKKILLHFKDINKVFI